MIGVAGDYIAFWRGPSNRFPADVRLALARSRSPRRTKEETLI